MEINANVKVSIADGLQINVTRNKREKEREGERGGE